MVSFFIQLIQLAAFVIGFIHALPLYNFLLSALLSIFISLFRIHQHTFTFPFRCHWLFCFVLCIILGTGMKFHWIYRKSKMEMWGVYIHWTQVGSDYNDDLMNGNTYMYVVITVFVGFVFVFLFQKYMHFVS